MRKYESMSKEERIKHSDEVAIAKLQEELTKEIRTQLPRFIEEITNSVVKNWRESRVYKDYLKNKYGSSFKGT